MARVLSRLQAFGLSIVVACSGAPDAPAGPPTIMADALVTGNLAAGETREYSLNSPGDVNIVAQLDAVEGTVMLTFNDAAGHTLGTLTRNSPSFRIDDFATDPIVLQEGARYTVKLSAQGGAPARYNVRVAALGYPPEGRSALIQVGELVSGSITRFEDNDQYFFDGLAGRKYALFTRVITPMWGTRRVQVRFGEVRNAWAIPGGDGLDDHPLTWTAPATARFHVLVEPDHASRYDTYPRDYEFQVYEVNPGPEHSPSTLVVGDTIVEEIDRHTDYDVFTMQGPPSALYTIFAQRGGGGGRELKIGAFDVDGEYQGDPHLALLNANVPLLGTVSGRFRARSDGRFTVRVEPETFGYGEGHTTELPPIWYRGSYRFMVARIDTLPERANRAIRLGDPVVGDSINLPGDIDDYTLTVPSTTLANFGLENPNGAFTDNVWVELAPASGGTFGSRLQTSPDSISKYASKREILAAGTYRLRVSGFAPGYRGSYLLRTYALDSLPEGVPASMAIGQAVNERILPAGDLDIYKFSATAGQHLNATLVMPTPSSDKLDIVIEEASGQFEVASGIQVADSVETRRFTIPKTGTYRARVIPLADGALVRNQTDYRLRLYQVPSNPERHPAAIMAPDTIDTEAMDSPGDIDEFILTATPGQQVQAWVEKLGEDGPTLDFFDPATGNVLAMTHAYGVPSPFVTVPPSGKLRVRLYEARNSSGGPATFHQVGPYRFAILKK